MKSFTLCVALVTLLCFFLNTLETKGQLSFNPEGRFRKTGRSLYQVSTELFQSTRDKLRSDIFASWLLQGRRGWGVGVGPGHQNLQIPVPYSSASRTFNLSPQAPALVYPAVVHCCK